MSLGFILGLKAGIGRNFAEAEAAMKEADKLKPKINKTDPPNVALEKTLVHIDSGEHAIVVYDGEPIEPNRQSSALQQDVEQTYGKFYLIQKQYGEHSNAAIWMGELIERRCMEPNTGTLSNFGYLYNLLIRDTIIEAHPSLVEGANHYFILFDANNMKYWNTNDDYEEVSKRIDVIGQSLIKGTRSDYESEFGFRLTDMVVKMPAKTMVNRTHGDGGDEFLIDMYCPEEFIMPVVQRLVDSVYDAQKRLFLPTSD